MVIIDLFIEFCSTILNFKVFDIRLINYLMIFLGIIFIFKIISTIGNSNSIKNKKVKEKSSDK